MSSFFNEACKVLGIERSRTSSYHSQSNGHVERLLRTLHTAMSHYVNSSQTYWDVNLMYFLLAYRATPQSTTGYSPFFFLHSREMFTPANEN
jgi:transposase InsO family protein